MSTKLYLTNHSTHLFKNIPYHPTVRTLVNPSPTVTLPNAIFPLCDDPIQPIVVKLSNKSSALGPPQYRPKAKSFSAIGRLSQHCPRQQVYSSLHYDITQHSTIFLTFGRVCMDHALIPCQSVRSATAIRPPQT